MVIVPRHQLPSSTDVLIVGAGPTGLALACQLARAKVDHLIVDRALDDSEGSRAAVVHAGALRALEPLGVTEPLLRAGRLVSRLAFCSREARLFELAFSGLPSPHPYMLMLPQKRAELILERKLGEHGSFVARGWRAAQLSHEQHGVTVALAAEPALVGSNARSLSATVRARYVVGCDGVHSTVRSAAGIAFEGSAYAEAFVLADVHMIWPLPRAEVQLFFTDEGLLLVAPLPGDQHRVVATLDRAPRAPDRAFVEAILARRGPLTSNAVVQEVTWGRSFEVQKRIAARYRSGRLLLAGDAAHVHSPAGGHGMNTGLGDALELGARLLRVLQGGDADAELDGYEQLRRPIALEALRASDRLTRAATLKGALAGRMRNQAARLLAHSPSLRRRLALQLAELTTAPARAVRPLASAKPRATSVARAS